MSDDEAFVAAVTESPNDAFLRLVYADWLDERDDPRGQFLRLELEAVQRSESGPGFSALQGQLAEISQTIDAGWRRAVCRIFIDPWAKPAFPLPTAGDWLNESPQWLEEQLRQQLITEDEPRQRAGRRWAWAYAVMLLCTILFLLKIGSVLVDPVAYVR